MLQIGEIAPRSVCYDRLSSDLEAIDRYISHKEERPRVHSLHDYPARFLPQIPGILIKNLTCPGEVVLDPMMGSGTTVEIAERIERSSIGFDLHPLSPLIASVEGSLLSGVEQAEIKKLAVQIQHDIENGLAGTVELPLRADFHNRKLWFRDEVLQELLFIRRRIDASAGEAIRRVLYLSLSRICKRVSNADPRDLFPQRDRNCPVRPRLNVGQEFHESVHYVLDCLYNQRKARESACIFQGDARRMALSNHSVDLIVFSPPYSCALEYVRVHQLSLSILGYRRLHLREHRRLYIGSDKIHSAEELPPTFVKENRLLVDRAISGDPKWGRLFLFFLYRMTEVFSESYRVLRPGGHLGVIAGDNQPKGAPLPVVTHLTSLAEHQGFRLCLEKRRPYYRRRLAPERNKHSSRIEADTVLVFRKDL